MFNQFCVLIVMLTSYAASTTVSECQTSFTTDALAAEKISEKCTALTSFQDCLSMVDELEKENAELALQQALESLPECKDSLLSMQAHGTDITFRTLSDGDVSVKRGADSFKLGQLYDSVKRFLGDTTETLSSWTESLRASWKQDIAVTDTTVSDLQGKLADALARIKTLEDDMKLKASQSDVDGIDTRVQDLEDEITEKATSQQLNSARSALQEDIDATSDAVDNVEGRVTEAEKNIDDLEDDVGAIQTESNSMDGRLKSLEIMTPGTTNLVKSSPDNDLWDEAPKDFFTTKFIDGQMIKAMVTHREPHGNCYGVHFQTHKFPLDPKKTYEFSIWIKSTGIYLNNYFGYHLFNQAGTFISGSYNNPYFKTSEGDPDEWVRWSGLLLPSYVPQSNGIAVHQSVITNGQDWVMHPATASARLRFVTCYDQSTASGIKTMYAFPSVVEVHPNALVRDKSARNVEAENLKLNGNVNVNGGLYMYDKLQFQSVSPNPDRGHMNLAFMMAGGGNAMGGDEYFRNGVNTLGLYNNRGGCALSMTRISGLDSPNRYGFGIRFIARPQTCSGISPEYGGFYDYETAGHHTVFVQRFVAKLPVGYKFWPASNSLGANSAQYFMTDNEGTGDWEYYVVVRERGNSGNQHSTGHVYVRNSNGKPASGTLTWYLASHEGYYF